MDKPEVDNLEEILVYLDNLRDSGAVNMYGSGMWLRDSFEGMDKPTAKDVVMYWMDTFEERHDDGV